MANGRLDALVTALAGLAKQAVTGLVGLAVLAGIAVFTDDPFATFFRLLTLVGAVLFVVGVVATIVTFRRAREIEPVALLVSLAVALSGSLVSFALAAPTPALWRAALALAAGGALGAAWAVTTLLWVEEGRVRGRGTLWWLAIWALGFLVAQGATLVGGRTAETAAVLVSASAGLAAGHTLALVFRVRRARAAIAGERSP